VFDAQIRLDGKPTFRRLEAIDVDAAIAEAAALRAGLVEPKKVVDGVTVAELVEAMIADMRSGRYRMRSGKPYKTSTIDLYELALTQRICRLLEGPWRALERRDIDRVVDELAAVMPANTCRNTVASLRTLDRFAHRRLGTARLTVELDGVPVSQRQREPVLVGADVIAEVPERHRVAAALALFGGLRASEACALEWHHVTGDTLVVEQQLDQHGATTTLKSRNSVRRIPIVPQLRAELDAQADRARQKQDELARRRPLEGRVYEYDRHVLRRALKRSLDISPQDLRHSFKETLREAGVGEVDSARLAGHSPQVGSTHYASGDSVERAREQVVEAFS
jgi:integrase